MGQGWGFFLIVPSVNTSRLERNQRTKYIEVSFSLFLEY